MGRYQKAKDEETNRGVSSAAIAKDLPFVSTGVSQLPISKTTYAQAAGTRIMVPNSILAKEKRLKN
jgi:hypothetical protein